ncbi:MAG: hypothetical protein ACE5G6_00560 [Terriglobia bacterium]
MGRTRVLNSVLLALLLLLGAGAGLLVAHLGRAAPQERQLTITAHKYAFDPPVVEVNRGDRITLRLVAKDVTHGFYLEGYDLDAKARPENNTFWVRHPSVGSEEYEEVEKLTFVADRTGKFRYRCSVTCGYMHPFMQGELIVRPNYLFSASVGLTLALGLGLLLVIRRPPEEGTL